MSPEDKCGQVLGGKPQAMRVLLLLLLLLRLLLLLLSSSSSMRKRPKASLRGYVSHLVYDKEIIGGALMLLGALRAPESLSHHKNVQCLTRAGSPYKQ